MASSWAYGVTDQGQPQLLGPYESDDEANDAAAELNGVRIVYAPSREEAIRQLQSGRAPSRRRREPVDSYQREYDASDREMEAEMAQYERDIDRGL